MPDVNKLKGINKAETRELRAARVQTIEQLWLRISEEEDNGFDDLVNKTGIPQGRLMKLLSDEAMRHAGKFGSSRLREHWLDFGLILGLLLFVLRIWLLLR
jgi:hypothetical protein